MNPLNNLPSAVSGAIPARAGFTGADRLRRGRDPDHPRSRGVYSGGWLFLPADDGSSPLARGLHAPGPAGRRPDRIIPARTGFTRPDWSGSSPRTDHPRSRGVYSSARRSRRSRAGSSPLARGLPCGSLESQRTRTLPDPCCLHCRPGARSAGSRELRRRSGRRPPLMDVLDATRPPRVSDPGSDTTPTCAGEWRRRPARSGSRRSGGSAPPRSRG